MNKTNKRHKKISSKSKSSSSISAEEVFQLNKSIDMHSDQEDNDHIPKLNKSLIFMDSKTVNDQLDKKISIDEVLINFKDGRSLQSLSPD